MLFAVKKEQYENYINILELLPTKQLRFPSPKRNPKKRTKNSFRKTNRNTPSIQQRPRPHHKEQKKTVQS